MAWRLSEAQRSENKLLEEIDTLFFCDELVIDSDDTVRLSREQQRVIISENFTTFADISVIADDLKNLPNVTLIVKNTVTQEEKNAYIQIEGGV